jgi:hypothetical protein
MKRICPLQLLVVALVWIPATLPQASVLRAVSLRQLVTDADQIVLAKVISVQAGWDGAHRKILSTIEIEAEQIWKGDLGTAGRLSIVQPGGTVGDIEMAVEGMPRFTPGEEALLFLRGGLRPQVLGLAQGKRTLERDTQTGRWVLQPSDMTAVVERGRDAKIRHPQPARPVDLDDFHAQVESLLRP